MSVGYGSMRCVDNNEWYFGGPDDDWSFWVPDIDWRSLGSAMDSP